MQTDGEIDDDLEESAEDYVQDLKDSLQELERRCKDKNIECTIDDDEDFGLSAIILIPAGREKRKIQLYNTKTIKKLLNINFENYKYLKGYEAIVCDDEKSVEVGLKSVRIASEAIIRRIMGSTVENPRPNSFSLVPDASDPNRPEIIIGPASDQLKVLSSRPLRFSLKMKNIRHSQHDQILSELKSYSDSLFFQIDTLVGATFFLARHVTKRFLPSPRSRDGVDLKYPVEKYGDESISLFMYAKSATDMPLLQFLGYYQSVEFYFPRYAQSEARRRARHLLKNPAFRAHKEEDIDQLISAIQGSKSSAVGGERSQLMVVINECFTSDEFKEFLKENKSRENYYSKVNKFSKIPISSNDADLRSNVCDRIYEIRCAIVHAKDEGFGSSSKIILPFSEDASRLEHDISLMRFIARRVISLECSELR